ncbi:MAG: PorV/PorQ family protein [Ignavibacteriaceae bacterium]|nr:PorV/PorQ family protein [Ignavibacteriaceae bacterium]
MKNTLFKILFLAVIAGTINLQAQLFRNTSKVGTTVASFLKIGAGSRALAMGGAYSAVSDDIYGLYWNPAGIARSKANGEVTFNHAEWLADISYDFAAVSINIEEIGTLAFSVTSLSVPEEKVRTEAFPEGDGRVWDAGSLAFGLGYARQLTDRFSVGFHVKYIRESIWNTSASAMAIDIGTYYISPFNDMVIGASFSNFGTKMQLDGRDILFNYDPDGDPAQGSNNLLSKYEMGTFDLPLSFRLGLSMNVYKDRYFRVTTALDATHPNDNTEYLNGGVEVAFNEMLMFRAGYKSLFLRDSEQGLTLGGGVNYEVADMVTLCLNYAWADYGRLKSVQFLDLSIKY